MTKDDPRVEAEAARLYEAYRAAKPGGPDGEPTPAWNDRNQHEDVRAAWRAVAHASTDRDISTDELLLGLRRHLGTQPGHLATPGFLEKLENVLQTSIPRGGLTHTGRYELGPEARGMGATLNQSAEQAHVSARPITSDDAGILASIDRALLAIQNGDTMSAEQVLAQERERLDQTRRRPVV